LTRGSGLPDVADLTDSRRSLDNQQDAARRQYRARCWHRPLDDSEPARHEATEGTAKAESAKLKAKVTSLDSRHAILSAAALTSRSTGTGTVTVYLSVSVHQARTPRSPTQSGPPEQSSRRADRAGEGSAFTRPRFHYPTGSHRGEFDSRRGRGTRRLT
jgi:hypothetical protein